MPALRANMIHLLRDTRGAMLVIWGVALAVMLGLVAMTFDIGRISLTQTELQSYTDSVALAAAGELDGQSDAITRATAAAANLITDRQTFGEGDHTLSGAADYSLTFFASLPNSDNTTPTDITTDPSEARFVRVTATALEVELTFGAAFASLSGVEGPDRFARATSIASMSRYACDVTPLMFCKPSGWSADANKGHMINLRSGGNGAAWGPGDFGFLDPSRFLVDTTGPCAGLNGVNLDACLLGAVGSITQCYSYDGVDTEPGQKNGIENAIFNVRFDIYNTIMNGEKNNPDYAPAPNVIKGIVPSSGGGGGGGGNGNGNGNGNGGGNNNGGGSGGGGNQCIGNNEALSPDTVGLPRDGCFAAGTCGRFGDGNWSAGYANYIATNYGGVDPFGINPATNTRYDLYKAEISNPQGSTPPGGGDAGILPDGLAESGLPQCSSATPAGPERRLVIAAAIDCTANPINGSEVGVPVSEFVEIFLTEPVGDDGNSPPTIDIWGEVIGKVAEGTGAGSTGIFRDVVQLYR